MTTLAFARGEQRARSTPGHHRNGWRNARTTGMRDPRWRYARRSRESGSRHIVLLRGSRGGETGATPSITGTRGHGVGAFSRVPMPGSSLAPSRALSPSVYWSPICRCNHVKTMLGVSRQRRAEDVRLPTSSTGRGGSPRPACPGSPSFLYFPPRRVGATAAASALLLTGDGRAPARLMGASPPVWPSSGSGWRGHEITGGGIGIAVRHLSNPPAPRPIASHQHPPPRPLLAVEVPEDVEYGVSLRIRRARVVAARRPACRADGACRRWTGRPAAESAVFAVISRGLAVGELVLLLLLAALLRGVSPNELHGSLRVLGSCRAGLRPRAKGLRIPKTARRRRRRRRPRMSRAQPNRSWVSLMGALAGCPCSRSTLLIIGRQPLTARRPFRCWCTRQAGVADGPDAYQTREVSDSSRRRGCTRDARAARCGDAAASRLSPMAPGPQTNDDSLARALDLTAFRYWGVCATRQPGILLTRLAGCDPVRASQLRGK